MTIIERRYQLWGPKGLDWSKWYTYKIYNSREDAEKAFPTISKIMETKKLKAEYRIV